MFLKTNCSMKKAFLYFIILLNISCKQEQISKVELFTVSPQRVEDLKSKNLQSYIGDTIFSKKKISRDSITKTFRSYDGSNNIKQKLYYVIPKVYSNIFSENNVLPYETSISNNKGFYNYIRTHTNNTFVAYVVNENEIVFKDYIEDFEIGNNKTFSTDQKLLDFLKSQNINFKIIKNKFDPQSERYYLVLQTFSEKDSTINRIVLSKFDFQMQTYYKSDTLTNWRKVPYDIFKY